MSKDVFISGGTGFLGRAVIPVLLARGHRVRVLARPESMGRIPPHWNAVAGDALDGASFEERIVAGSTFIHLVGTAKPAPWKGSEFRRIDLMSLKASAAAAVKAGAGHFIFLSVAHPAPVMRAYIEVRRECERILARSGLTATILRPWYVVGPGRRWPLVLVPFYKLAEFAGLEGARRLGLVSLGQMVDTMTWAVENPGSRVLEVPEIQRTQLQ